MTIKEILEMSNEDFVKLRKNELQPLVNHMISVANRRMNYLERANVTSPALISRDGQRFNKIENTITLNQLRAQYMKVSQFLNNKTSIVGEARKFNKMVSESINALREDDFIRYSSLTHEQQSDIWKLYESIKEIDEQLFESLSSEQRISLASKFYRRDSDYDKIKAELRDYIYEKGASIQDGTNPDLKNAKGLLHVKSNT